MKQSRMGMLAGMSAGVLLCAGWLSVSWGQAAKPEQNPPEAGATASAKDKEWKPEDIVMSESAGGFEISPDNKWVVWVKGTADKDKDGRVSNLMLTSLTSKKEIQLTRGTDTNFNPKWSPNGELISFLSTKPQPKPTPDAAGAQLWLLSLAGGEPWPVTEFGRGIRNYKWIDDNTILFSAQEDPTFYEREVKKKKDTSRVVDDTAHEPPVRLFRFTVKDKKVTRLSDNDDWIGPWDVTKDGNKAITVHSQYLSYAWDQKIPPKTFVYDLTTGKRTELFPDGKIRPYGVEWAKDGSGAYVIAPYTTDPRFFTATIALLYFYDAGSGKVTQVDLGWENGLGGAFEVTPDGFLASLDNGVRFKAARYTKSSNGWTRAFLEGEHANNYFGYAVSEDGKAMVYRYATASLPSQWYRATLDGAKVTGATQITDLNPQYKNKAIAKTEVIRWKGANDEEVEGLLYYPTNYEPGKKYPLLTAPHGGPAGADMDAWSESWAYANNLLTQRGAFILKPNYHGSSNYGLKWVESICCGKYYELEVPDIEKGVDLLIAKGLVDPERIGTMGWSNGSILSTQLLVTNPSRYKVAAVGAGDVEWISDWGNVAFGQSFDAYYFGKSPLEDPALYIKKSPVFQLDKVKAPVLIFHGTEDTNVPTSQSWTYYRALYHLNKTVRFVLFPGEPHGLGKLTHQLRKLNEELAWFDRYLFKTEKPENEAFSEESPLGIAFRKKNIAKVGAAYGFQLKPKEHTAKIGRLKITATGSAPEAPLPEVVKRGELEIGRFEVTRAQYAGFDPNYKIAPGTENFPANGITFEKAKEYAAWLSKLTGQTWRVPNEDEVKGMYEGRSGENTLDYWAGYAINPDDAKRLEAKVKELGNAAPLLKEVGSFGGAGKEGEELIFDLGGNVAEWVLTKDGTGKTLGGSADRAADAKAQFRAATADYTGFRVVRGEPKKEEKKEGAEKK
jgi:dipeptidyl aminopeptidase/acylaminoacyl peptidase